MYNEYNYTAYLASGEIIECDDFKTLFRAARFNIRISSDCKAVIINRKDGSTVAALRYMGGPIAIYRAGEIEDHKIELKLAYSWDDYGRFCWDMAGLE